MKSCKMKNSDTTYKSIGKVICFITKPNMLMYRINRGWLDYSSVNRDRMLITSLNTSIEQAQIFISALYKMDFYGK